MTSLELPRHPELRHGYESYYLRACRPEGGLGFWIRYTVHRAPGQAPVGSLWFTLFSDSAESPVATKTSSRSVRADPETWLGVGSASIGPGACAGSIAVEGHPTVRWELDFRGSALLQHLPARWLYGARLPRTKAASIHPFARFRGTVEVDGQVLDVGDWPGMVGHNWGAEHAERWVWLHGMGFDGAGDDTWLDVVVGRVRAAGRTSPWLASGALSLDGRRLSIGGPLHAARTRIEEAPGAVSFELRGRGVRVNGAAGAPHEQFVAWIYADADGGEHHTLNCSVANLALTVRRPGGRTQNLQTRGLAVYELGLREQDHGVLVQPFADGVREHSRERPEVLGPDRAEGAEPAGSSGSRPD